MEKPKFIRINEKDNVAIAVEGLQKGDSITVDGVAVVALEDIPRNHKIALTAIPKGSVILKYGEEIGLAGQDIPAGSWVHAHNVQGSADPNQTVADRFEAVLGTKEAAQ